MNKKTLVTLISAGAVALVASYFLYKNMKKIEEAVSDLEFNFDEPADDVTHDARV